MQINASERQNQYIAKHHTTKRIAARWQNTNAFCRGVIKKKYQKNTKQKGYLIAKGSVISGGTALFYNTPYARYVWYGNVMKGGAPKYTTNKPLTYQESPIRGKKWVLRTMQEEKAEILQAVAKEAGGRAEW